MKAMLSTRAGGPESLELTELPMPEPAKGEVRIRVRAAGVNYPDILIIRDLYQVKPPRPFAPGGEISGEVEALGEGVTGLETGDRVLALPGVNGFASHVVVAASRVVKIPDAMPFDQAACFVLTYGTSYHALKDRAAIRPGESLLVLGAAGGVGAAAVELGKAAGARVIAAVSSDEKATFCREIGADAAIVYPRNPDRDAQKALSAEIRAAAGGEGVNVVYDAVGGDYAQPALRAMAWGGRFLVVGFPAGIPNVPLNLTLLQSIDIQGIYWGAWVARNPKGQAENMRDLFALHAEGAIRPRISASFPLADAAAALQMLEARKVMGKVVLTIDD